MRNEQLYRNNAGLNMNDLERVAPAIFARHAAPSRSDRYAFIPTHATVEALIKTGLQPVEVRSKRVMDPEDRGFAKHALRFRIPSMTTRQVGDTIPEIVLTNSHDGGSAYQLMMGFFRLVCSNGLVVQTGSMGFVSVKHVGRGTPEAVVERSRELVERVPLSLAQVELMRKARLEYPEQVAFARSALALRWDPEHRHDAMKARGNAGRRTVGSSYGDAPITADSVLHARRFDDQGADVWSVFNRVQENLTKGGQSGYATSGRRMRTRPIEGMDRDLKLNRQLWVLAAELAKAKLGQPSKLDTVEAA